MQMTMHMNPSRSGPSAIWLLMLALMMSLLAGCSNEYLEDIEKRYPATEKRIKALAPQLDGGKLTNALLVRTYSKQLIEQKPELREAAELLAKEATTKGGLYTNLSERLTRVNRKPENRNDYLPAFEELEALWAASDPVVFNDALLDVVNTLADLSGGKLERINIPNSAKANQLEGKQGQVPMSYMVGNPAYGNWKTDSSGKSFWEWYGQYRLISDVVGGIGGGRYHYGSVYYDDWYSRPRYSYYHDYGRSAYGSVRDRSSWSSQGAKRYASVKPQKSYASVAGQKRVSTYSTMRSSNRSSGGKLVSASSSASSSSSAKRSSSFFGSSSRGTSSSRSGSGGK